MVLLPKEKSRGTSTGEEDHDTAVYKMIEYTAGSEAREDGLTGHERRTRWATHKKATVHNKASADTAV